MVRFNVLGSLGFDLRRLPRIARISRMVDDGTARVDGFF